ncbi:MAG: DUF2851 family protein [Cytophagaceae bacterium]|jgi:hypothetical protein|nr:DUF2851 family protein [Cytophagaceae bacterium]
MTEELFHYLWRFRLYLPEMYKTSDGQALEIIHPGMPNKDAGPDFFNAKIKLGDTLWAGNVELHLKASDWNRHGHQNNKAYDNVILHVVAENNAETVTCSGVRVPVWQMPVNPQIAANYSLLLKAREKIPCSEKLNTISDFEFSTWMERMAVEKLEEKMFHVGQLLNIYTNNISEVFYIMLARVFGFGLNSEPFEQMARQTPLSIVLKNIDRLNILEALFLGQAGFLDEPGDDEYMQVLYQEYRFLRKKYNLIPLPKHQWKFLRLRPSNFPTIRIIQFAKLLHIQQLSPDKILKETDFSKIDEALRVQVSSYWETHYIQGVESPQKTKKLGKGTCDLITINALIPFLFIYGKTHGNDTQCEKALAWLRMLKAEQNSIVKQWKDAGVTIENALQSQAVIHLTRSYCQHRKCLHCRIGHLVISKKAAKFSDSKLNTAL